ncbi:winged helix-turn-helix domain-containing protein [Paracoccus sp. SY]|uniref:winged helix-turn-helix domain-containing protein n=1 Tax=Paracoccus sp. SY TaxID=1330255 RepID=UPI000CD1E448|nr:LysR family transcriptional regulator [Paracoccus sp. SY]
MDRDGPRIKLRLEYDAPLVLGPGKAQLLRLIGQHGSISAAGRQMGMSYKRAWSLVEEMNAAFVAPLVDSSRGGAGGGGATVTPTGLAVLRHYESLERLLTDKGAADLAAIGALMKTEEP